MDTSPNHLQPFAWTIVRTWVLVSAWLSFWGWGLAWCGQLNARGYIAGFIMGGILLALRKRHALSQNQLRRTPRGWGRWRWRQPLPRVFLGLYLLITSGAALHAPNNYDALTYRVPQILHWLAEENWHWIPVSDLSINISPPGYGWWMAPMVSLLRTDRLFAIPNLVAYAFLPGLFFSVLRHCGVHGRVAWHWMWLLPTASGIAMQAGSTGNDMLPMVYVLAALALILRALRFERIGDFWLSILAAALATGVKFTAVPVLFSWIALLLPARKLASKHPGSTLLVFALAASISFLPTAVLNIRHTGSWTGDPTDVLALQIDSPIHAVAGNSAMLLTGALEPSVCPFAPAAQRAFRSFAQSSPGRWIAQGFPRFNLKWGELASEEASGLGLGLLGMAVISGSCRWLRGRTPRMGACSDYGRWIWISSLAGFSVWLLKSGSESAARLAIPYYPLLLIALLSGRGQAQLTRQRWWRATAVLAAASILPAVILTPSRPLWPAESSLAWLAKEMPMSQAISRATRVYAAYRQRDDHVASLKPFLPDDGRVIGFVRQVNDIEAPLWKPYGSRRVREILTPSSDLSTFEHDIVVGARAAFDNRLGLSPEAFAQARHGEIIARSAVVSTVAIGPQEWVVIRLP